MQKSQIPIVSPCDADWSSMTREGRRRFCDICRKHVYDLSSMTQVETREFFAANREQNLCIRYIYDTSGKILFADDDRRAWNRELRAEFDVPVGNLVRAKRAAAVVALAATSPFTLAGCEPKYATMAGGGSGCPDIFSEEGLARVDERKGLGMDAGTHKRFVQELRAARKQRELFIRLDGELKLACREVNRNLGRKDGPPYWKEDCDAALENLRAARQKLGHDATFKVKISEPLCADTSKLESDCLARCEQESSPEAAMNGCGGTTPRRDCNPCTIACGAEALLAMHCSWSMADLEIAGASDPALAKIVTTTLNPQIGRFTLIATTLAGRLNELANLSDGVFQRALDRRLTFKTPIQGMRFSSCFIVVFRAFPEENDAMRKRIATAREIVSLVTGRAE